MELKVVFTANLQDSKEGQQIGLTELITAQHDTVNKTFRTGDQVYDANTIEARVIIPDEDIRTIAKTK